MEKIYHYLWKSRMFGRTLPLAGGGSLQVIDPGRHNTDSGPDFFNAKIRMDGSEWAGNVEIHVRASDWFRHGHDTDPAYDNVILHVVGVSDKRIARGDGSVIAQTEVSLPPGLVQTFDTLCSGADTVRCAGLLDAIPDITRTDWLESLSVERLQAKANRVYGIYKACSCDWEQTCFATLARALGQHLNGDPFEMLARSLPLKYLHRHSDHPLQIQALLFGQAAMLDSSSHILDEYYQALCREYFFLARKYGLKPMRPGLWKYSKTRPANSPQRRVALLAKACQGGFGLFSRMLDCRRDPEAMKGLFDWQLDGYWHTHSSFDLDAKSTTDTLGHQSLNLLLINFAAPLLYAYASHTGDPETAECMLDLLDQLPAEDNTYIRQWSRCGLTASSALRSQALLHLRREYCDTRKCLFCRFGHQVLRQASVT